MEMKSLNQELELLGEELVKGVVRELMNADKFATGKLVRSVDYRVITKANKLILEILALPYFENVMEGRKPGSKQPPISAIIPWVKKRNIKVKGAKTPEQSAFVIARSIGRKGIKPVKEIRKVIDDIYSKKEQLLAKAASEDIIDLIDKLLLKK